MKIKDIRASVHSVPVKLPLIENKIDIYGHGERQTFVFCEVETDDGITGFGLTSHILARSIVDALQTRFLSVVKDMDPRDVEAIHSAVWARLNPRASTGVISSALSCLDIALWDIHGKQANRTVAQLLGGHKSEIAAYVTFGMPVYNRDQLVEAAKLQRAAGFTAFKMVVYTKHGDWREDVRRVKAVRAAIGDDCDLMIDANMKFNPVEAKLLCRALEDTNLFWFEEPLHQNDARALADLRATTKIPLAAGQNEGHRYRLRELVTHHAVDVLQPSCIHCGGYTEQRKVAHLAQAFNLPIANGGGWPLFNMHAFAGLMNGWMVEWHLGTVELCETIFVAPPRPKNGKIAMPVAPGLGLQVNRDALKDSLVQR